MLLLLCIYNTDIAEVSIFSSLTLTKKAKKQFYQLKFPKMSNYSFKLYHTKQKQRTSSVSSWRPESVWSSFFFPNHTPVNQSQMFPPSFRYDVLGHGAGVPLRPPAVVHRHPGVPAFVGRQCHMTGGHRRATQHTDRAAEVDASSGEKSLELLLGQEVTRLGEEGVEGHVDRTGDVARLCICKTERENGMRGEFYLWFRPFK